MLAKRRNPGARVVLLEANTVGWAASGRNGGFCEASLTHGEENGRSRWPEEYDALERLGARRTSTPSRPTSATSAWTASSSAPAAEPSRSRSTRSSGCATSPRLPGPRRRTRARSTARSSWPASGAATTARWCTRPGWPASWRGSPPTSASRSTRAPGSPGSTRRRAGRSSSAPPAGSVTADRVALATNVFPSLLRRTRLLHGAGLRLRADDRAADRRRSSRRSAGRTGRALGDLANQFHYSRLTADNRILWGGYDAIYHTGRRVRGVVRGAAGDLPRARLALPRGLPAAGGADLQPPLGRRDRHLDAVRRVPRPRVARSGGVRRRLHRARCRRDPVRRRGDAGPAVRAVDRADPAGDGAPQAAAVPARAARVASASTPTRWSLDRADHRQGRRNLFLKTLDAVGLGFDS